LEGGKRRKHKLELLSAGCTEALCVLARFLHFSKMPRRSAAADAGEKEINDQSKQTLQANYLKVDGARLCW